MFCVYTHVAQLRLIDLIIKGSDYRSIFLGVLADDVTESGNRIQRDLQEFWWTDPESVIKYFDQVNSVLDTRAHVCNVSRFCVYGKKDARIPMVKYPHCLLTRA